MGSRQDLRGGQKALDRGAEARRQGRTSAAITAYEEAQGAFERLERSDVLVSIHNALGSLLQGSGKGKEAERHFRLALRYADDTRDDAARAVVLGNQGQLALKQGELDKAEGLAKEALDLFKAQGDQQSAGSQLQILAQIARAKGDEAQADALLVATSEAFKEAGDDLGQGRALLSVASAAMGRGQAKRAEEAYEEAGALLSAGGDLKNTAYSLRGLGHISMRRGELDEARERFVAALSLFKEVGDAQGRGATYLDLGRLSDLEGDLDAAMSSLDKAQAIAEEAGALNQLGRVALAKANTVLELGRLEEAEEIAQGALAHFEGQGHVQGWAASLITQGRITLAQGRLPQARTALEAAQALAEGAGLMPLEAAALIHMAELESSLGQVDISRRVLTRAAELYKEIDSPGGRHGALLMMLEREVRALDIPDLQSAVHDPRILQARAFYEGRGDSQGLMRLRALSGLLQRAYKNYDEAELTYCTRSQWLKASQRHLDYLDCMGMVALMRLRQGLKVESEPLDAMAQEALELGAPGLGLSIGAVHMEALIAEKSLQEAETRLRWWSNIAKTRAPDLVARHQRLADVKIRLAHAMGEDRGATAAALNALAQGYIALGDAVSAQELRGLTSPPPARA